MKARSNDSRRRSRSPAWRRLRRDRLARISALLLGLLLIAGLVTLPFSFRWYNVQELDTGVRHAPAWAPVVSYSHFTGGDGPPGSGWSGAGARAAHRLSSWMGHDDLGRSLFYRVWPGLLVSLAIGLSAALMSVVIGTAWGAVAALLGGRVDAVMMRVVDVLYGLPYILMVILLKIALTRPLTAMLGGQTRYADVVILLIAIGGVSWLTMARVVRGQVLSLREQLFVEAARAAGAGPLRILFRHILPNVVGPVAVYATLVIPQAILQESFLSFLGIGVQQPTPSLGRLAADGVEAVNIFVGYWWLIVFPCGVLVLTLLSLNFLGDALRDALDPKSSAGTLVSGVA
jgi:ABC-type dipeptide/oligopeptide/nickel transport system permease subunit